METGPTTLNLTEKNCADEESNPSSPSAAQDTEADLEFTGGLWSALFLGCTSFGGFAFAMSGWRRFTRLFFTSAARSFAGGISPMRNLILLQALRVNA
jgi:hypothetical protein